MATKTQKRYQRIVFMQGEEADEPLQILADKGRVAAVDYLAQWDMERGEEFDEPASGSDDDIYTTRDGYRLSWNRGLGYIGLEKVISTP